MLRYSARDDPPAVDPKTFTADALDAAISALRAAASSHFQLRRSTVSPSIRD
jgi:hypothetical protein